ncbi:S-layer homology domain-containing protein [Paenibacillus solisilvae]|uniref:S-layer homology domain-containing protein n=1 Tax=Paenibacillus solisilvae TaxID=2486751 RepID=A0ABW0W5R8_9BACL
MSLHTKWTRILSSFVIFSLLASLCVWGTTANASSAGIAGFSDVAAGHWAEKHIAKLALQGIVKGNNGLFKPNDNITQQEAVTLAVRFIGKENEINTDEAVVFPPTFQVGNYFKPYIVLAFNLGLLDRMQEFKLAETNPGSNWGEQKASREWITKLIIRAIGQQKLAESLDSTAVSFKDADKVGTGFKGYVNAAVQLQLVKGITADKFDPKGYATRASLATIFSRAESQFPVNYTGQSTGILSFIDGSSIKVYGESKEMTYQLTPDTYVTRFDSERSTTTDKLVLHAKISFITNGDKVVYLEQAEDKQQLETISGDLVSVLPDEHLLYILVQKKPLEISYDDKVEVKDASGAVIPVSSLPNNSKIEITRTAYQKEPQAISIKVQSAPVNKTGQGKIVSVEPSPASIKVLNAATNQEETFPVASQADVIWQGTIVEGGVAQIHAGDTVSYEVVNSVVTKIVILQSTVTTSTIRGEFYSASSDSKTIQYKRNAGTAQERLEAKFVTDAVEVTIEGLNGTMLTDLIKGDVLDLTLNQNDQVTAIKVVNRKVQVLNGVSIISYDADTKALLVKTASGGLVSVYLSDKTKIDYNGTSMTLSASSSFLVKNRKLTLGYTDDKAVLLQFVYKYTGTVTSINAVNNIVTINQSNGTTITLPLEYPSVDIYGKSNATLADVKVGDTVTALLNANQDKAVSLQVQTTAQYEVVSVDAAGKKLKLKSSGQVTAEYSALSWDFFNENGEKVTIANVSAGQIGNLNYMGSTPVSFKTVKVTVGRLAAAAADKLTIVDYNGASSDVLLGTVYSVVKNGVTSSSASTLQAGDRVEVKRDSKDQIIITVLSGLNKEFWKYDSSTGILSVKRANLSESNTFGVTTSTKVTQNDTPVSITQLKDGDKITLYFYQNKLVEIVKNT